MDLFKDSKETLNLQLRNIKLTLSAGPLKAIDLFLHKKKPQQNAEV